MKLGNNINLMVMKLDASDDRGINSVREEIKGFAERKNMFSRKQKIMQSNNLIAEKRYIKNKFLFEEESDLPELQVTPEGPGKSKIKFTWKSKGVTLPQDVRDSELFQKTEFEPLKKIYVDFHR